ncbi:hypothetical protein CsatB_019150 [Cannabis sativa]
MVKCQITFLPKSDSASKIIESIIIFWSVFRNCLIDPKEAIVKVICASSKCGE